LQPTAATSGTVRAVLFDLGGVLADFNGFPELAELTGAADVAAVQRRWLQSPSVRRFESGGCDQAAFAAGLIAEWQLPFTAEQLIARFDAWLGSPYPDAAKVVARAARGAAVGCLTNTNPIHWHTVARWPLTAAFSHRFLSFELGLVKPDAAIFDYAVTALALPAGTVLFLDDSPANVRAARERGLLAEQTAGASAAAAALAAHGL
jgi:HAD superfamily hydrolase (TIGR01509 family)